MFFINTDILDGDRLDLRRFVRETDEDGEWLDLLDTYLLPVIHNMPPEGRYFIQNEVGRMDLVSYRIYGQTQFWWILMEYNRLSSPMDVKEGIVLSYPSLNNIETALFSLKAKQRSLGQ